MPEDNDQSHGPPRASFAHHVPERLLRHIPVPDNEVLRESHIRIKHGESKQHRTDEIILVFVQHIGQHALPIQNHRDDIDCCQGHPHAARKIIDAVHGREPFMLQPFHPHDCAQRQSCGKEENSDARVKTHAVGRPGRAGHVLLQGPVTQTIRKQPPDQEAKS